MPHTSLWTESSSTTDFPQFTGTREVPVAVIGGGIAGVLTSYLLTAAGIHNILLEAGRIGQGTTGHTTAKVTAAHNLCYYNIAKSYGEGFALKYAQSNLDAIQCYQDIIAGEGIDCDFTKEDNYVYARTNPDADRIEEEYQILKKLGIPGSLTLTTSLPFQVLSALKMPDQAALHPLKFLLGIAKNLNIFEHSKVLSLDQTSNTLQTDQGTLRAEKIVLCTHFPFLNTPGYFFLKMFQQRSYVMAISKPEDFSGMYIDCNEKGHSFRTYKDLLLVGGSQHRCGHNESGLAYQKLEQYIHQFWPKSRILYRWSAQDCMPLDNLPYIGQFSKKTPNLYVATGFHKWGMTTAMAAASLLTDLISGKKNDYEALYTPSRFDLLSSAKNILSNTADTAKGLTTEQLTSENPTCPHLGCKLTWNPDEESWDCPCHGSRFDRHGDILCNPAQDRLVLPQS